MKSAKQTVLEYLEQELLKNNNQGITTQQVADALGMQRSNVSTLLNELVKSGQLAKTNTRPVQYHLVQTMDKNPLDFPMIIGEHGSLRQAIQLAQAAILYPNYALPIVVISEPGAGRTYFVNKMHDFAIQNHVVTQAAQFEQINCADYVDQLPRLLRLLFGDNSTPSILQQLAGGLLFIDNLHLLPVAEQNKLISWVEKREQQAQATQRKGLVVFGGGMQLLERIASKLPVVIQLPSYQQKPINEKLELLNAFFAVESKNARCDIQVERDIIHTLLLSDSITSIKELAYAIQTACANAFVRCLRTETTELNLTIEDLPVHYQHIRTLGTRQALKLDSLIGAHSALIYDKELGLLDFTPDTTHDLYGKLAGQYAQLTKRGLNQDDVQALVQSYIQGYVAYSPHLTEANDLENLTQLEPIVPLTIIQHVQEFIKTIQRELQRPINPTAYYGICLHINALVQQQGITRAKIENEEIVRIVRQYPAEYASCAKFAKQMELAFDLEIPIDEVVILTMFLIESDQELESSRPVLLYVLHGKGVAASLAESTQKLTKNPAIYGFDLLLEEDVEQSYQKLKQLIQDIDQGLGVLVIYDMGSIKNMLDRIQAETAVKIRELEIPITIIGMGIARRCLIERDVDQVYHAFNMEMNHYYQNRAQEKIIVTLCYTSEGGAAQLKRYIDQYSKLGYRVVALPVANRETLIEEVIALRKTYQIHAFVGTFDPKIMGIPFIPMRDIFEQPKEMLDKLLLFMPVTLSGYDYSRVYQTLAEQFKYVAISKIKRLLPNVLDEFNLYYQLNENQTLGLFVHIACLIERTLAGDMIQKTLQSQALADHFVEDYKLVRKLLRPLERAFKIIIDDYEVDVIIRIVRKI